MSKPVIYYHASCPDGFGAAYAAWRVFGEAARYLPMHHGDAWQPDDVRGEAVFILDFSFAPETLKEMAAAAASVTLIDHHVSARQPWHAHLQQRADGLEVCQFEEQPLRLMFNLEKSGARLAWEHFHPEQPLPRLLAHVEDMDIWRFALPDTRAISRALRLLPYDFAAWHDLILATEAPNATRYASLIAEGRAIERFMHGEIERAASSRLVTPLHLKGEAIDPLQAMRHGQPVITDENGSWLPLAGLAINADSLFASELGNRLAEMSGTFGAIWQVGQDGLAKVSLRACGKINVAVVAERYGGGGHPNAAGFRIAASELLRLLGH